MYGSEMLLDMVRLHQSMKIFFPRTTFKSVKDAKNHKQKSDALKKTRVRLPNNVVYSTLMIKLQHFQSNFLLIYFLLCA